MPTKYDVFARITEKAPCRIKDLDFNKPVYIHVSTLKRNGWISEKNNRLIPIKNVITKNIFNIIKFSLKNGLDYNIFFTKSMKNVLLHLPKSIPNLRPESLKGNKEISAALKYLEEHQFILKFSKKPARGRILKHTIFDSLAKIHDLQMNIRKFDSEDLIKKILSIKEQSINPFEKKIFSFLAGSAQLEGSTITEGETIDLILKDIYPEKSSKDIQMVKNLNEAIKYIFENMDEEITPERIMEINRFTMFSLHANAGKYKTTQNRIAGNPSFKTALPKAVPELMLNFCKAIKEITTTKEILSKLANIHNNFQRIHPFSDGNSRTTRMLVNWFLIKNGLPLLVLKMGAFDEYMNLTKLSYKRDDTSLNHLFLELLWHENLND